MDEEQAVDKIWPWVAGIAIGLCIFGLVAAGRSERRAYWAAHGVMVRQAHATPQPEDWLMRRQPGR